jgi:hypothetical protein
MAAKVFSFSQTISKLRSTEQGKEAAMYGPLRDLFLNLFGYPAADADIDVSGEGGRPDVTVKAPSGLIDADGNPTKISWIVVEAKDENVFTDSESREQVYAKKAKYIGPNTGWFVMADPTIMVARQVGGKTQAADVTLALTATLTEEQFLSTFAGLSSKYAGVPEQLKRFREGDLELIASEKLDPPGSDAPTRVRSQYQVSRKRFYTNLRDATQHLQDACRHALRELMPNITSIRALLEGFADKYGGIEACSFDSGTLMLTGRPQGREESRTHDKDARALRKRFMKDPHIARLALEGLPLFQSRTGAEDEKVEELFAIETANLILARVLLLRFFEDHGFFGDQRYICNGGVEA